MQGGKSAVSSRKERRGCVYQQTPRLPPSLPRGLVGPGPALCYPGPESQAGRMVIKLNWPGSSLGDREVNELVLGRRVPLPGAPRGRREDAALVTVVVGRWEEARREASCLEEGLLDLTHSAI